MLYRWIITTISIAISAYLITGVTVDSLWTAVWLAVLLGLINVTIKPVSIILTLPINILTLGLFTFVINALLILFASSLLKGFNVDGFWIAMLFSIALSAVTYLLNVIFKDTKK